MSNQREKDMPKFNVFYEVYDRTTLPPEAGPVGYFVRTYCLQSMNINEAKEMLDKFRSLYLDDDGNGKAFPNGKGFYNYRNPHIRRV
jgi:hypothetical protein